MNHANIQSAKMNIDKKNRHETNTINIEVDI